MLIASQEEAKASIWVEDKKHLPVGRELRRILKAMTGATLLLETGKAASSQAVIRLVVQPAIIKRYSRRLPRVRDVVQWHCDGRHSLEIAGNTEEALWLSLYAFCEKVLDCRWFFPGKAGEDIPQRRELRIKRQEHTWTPSFITRDLHFWPHDFQRKKLGGGPRMRGIHSYSDVAPDKVVKNHPELAVMIDGERKTEGGFQRCVSQKRMEELAVQYCLDFFKENPDELIVGVSPNDGENFCDCPDCVSANLGRKLRRGEPCRSPWWVTRSIFEFTNRVAARVAEVYPDKLVLTIAYSRTKEPMRGLKIHDNVIVDYCSQPHFNWQGKGARAKLEREITAWCKEARHVGIFDYILNQSWPGLVRPLFEILSHELKYFHKRGVRYYYSQHGCDFGVNLPNYYLMTSLLWDVSRDKGKVLNDLYKRCFRQAATPVKAYYQIMEAAIMEKAATGPGPGEVDVTGHRRAHENVCAIFNEDVLATAAAALTEARRRVKDDPVARKRLRLITRAFDYLKVAVGAARTTFEFETRYRLKSLTPWAWNVGNYDYANTLEKLEMFGTPCVDAFQEVRKVWQEYRRVRYKLEEERVLSPRYSRGGRSFDASETVENVWGLYTGKLKKVPPLVSARSTLRAM